VKPCFWRLVIRDRNRKKSSLPFAARGPRGTGCDCTDAGAGDGPGDARCYCHYPEKQPGGGAIIGNPGGAVAKKTSGARWLHTADWGRSPNAVDPSQRQAALRLRTQGFARPLAMVGARSFNIVVVTPKSPFTRFGDLIAVPSRSPISFPRDVGTGTSAPSGGANVSRPMPTGH